MRTGLGEDTGDWSPIWTDTEGGLGTLSTRTLEPPPYLSRYRRLYKNSVSKYTYGLVSRYILTMKMESAYTVEK
jgi:hypothetical protein